MRAPSPIATYLLIIAVPLEASLPTLVSRTTSICALLAELEMNVGFSGRAPADGAILGPASQPAVGRKGPIARRPNTSASAPSPHFCELQPVCRGGYLRRHPATLSSRSPGLSGDAGLPPSRLAADLGVHATRWAGGTGDDPIHPLPPERTVEERDE